MDCIAWPREWAKKEETPKDDDDNEVKQQTSQNVPGRASNWRVDRNYILVLY